MARRKRSLPPYGDIGPRVDIGLNDEQVDQILEETVELAMSGNGTWHYPERGRPSLSQLAREALEQSVKGA